MSFKYQGVIPASKSIMNRALICSSYQEGLQLEGSSSCDDVIKMINAVTLLKTKNSLAEYDCGAAGTVLRFLSLRLSRIPGKHILKGTERLLQRPQQDLLDLFKRLGVNYELSKNHMILESKGWQNISEPILVQRNVSSQFASGLILNAWQLNQDLKLDMIGEPMSEGYLEMTLKLVESLGMNIQKSGTQLTIKANSQINKKNYQVESDLSSLFAVAAFAVLNGKAQFDHFPIPSLQPDSEFLDFFKKMNIPFELENGSLKIFPTKNFKGLEANLKSCPDLFPVLAVLCSFASTPSRLHGAPQLIHKESNRIAKVAELLNALGVKNEPQADGMIIHPQANNIQQVKSFEYDTDHDHRLAFASALVLSQKVPITIKFPEVVSKSFPEFWQVVGLDPK